MDKTCDNCSTQHGPFVEWPYGGTTARWCQACLNDAVSEYQENHEIEDDDIDDDDWDDDETED